MRIFLSISFCVVALFAVTTAKDEDWEDIDVVALGSNDQDKKISEEDSENAYATVATTKSSPDACPVLTCDKICPCGYATDLEGCYVCECKCNYGDQCEHDCEYGRKISYTGDLSCECAHEPYLEVCKAFCQNIPHEVKECEICPHCNCNGQVNNCPTLECNTVCKYGYSRDYNNCPTCNCQAGPDDSHSGDPCYYTNCVHGQVCKVFQGVGICVGEPSPITTLPPMMPPKCPELVCGSDCTCNHSVRQDGCTICHCANACYGISCPPGTICIPNYVFEAFTGKLQISPTCRKMV